MALIIEDGTGVANAASWTTVAEATAILGLRGNATWATRQLSEKEGDLVQAADYLNSMFSWPGVRFVEDQPMALPTSYIDFIPGVLKTAQSLLAAEASQGPLLTASTGGSVTKERKKLDGVGEKEVTYESGSSGTRRFSVVEGLLYPFGIVFMPAEASSSAVQSARIYRS